MDWSFVTPRLAVGGGECLCGESVEALAADGITHIISHREKQEPILAAHPKMMLMWNPTADDGKPKPTWWFDKSINFSVGLLKWGGDHRKLYIHCYHGSNRSCSTTLAILMAQGYTFYDALEMILKVRPKAEIRYRGDARRAVKELGYGR
jgi:protein-tyrosine phosphatase